MKLKLREGMNRASAIAYAKFLDDIIYRHNSVVGDRLEEARAVMEAVANETLDNLLEMCEPVTKKFKVGIETTDEVFEVEAETEEEAKQKAFDLFMKSKHESEAKIIK